MRFGRSRCYQEVLAESAVLVELETVELIDLPKIELNDDGKDA